MRCEQIEQLRHKRIIDVIAFDNTIFTLLSHLQVRFKLSRIAGQGDRLQVLIGFQQILNSIAIVQQTVDVAARHNHRINGERWCSGKGGRNRQH